MLEILKRLPALLGIGLIVAICGLTVLSEIELSDGVSSNDVPPPDIGDVEVPPPAYDDQYCARVGEWDPSNPFRGWPTDNTAFHHSGFITTYFCDPNYGQSWEHEGLDFAWYLGTNAVATADAAIVQAGTHSALGNMVLLCSNGFCARYGHLDSIAPDIATGGTVSQGQVVGQVGTSGNSTGVHLHYDIYDSVGFVDPFPTLFQ
jgi:murein DD-endopeptidase MepM/ murein hydrolase activator NlpD